MPALPALDAELAALTRDPEHPLLAVAALAVRDGQVVYAQQFGARHPGDAQDPQRLPVTERTLFRVASISKLVVAVAVMRLVEQGHLALDRDVSEWLGWRLRHPRFARSPITLRLLLTHRSGLADGGERYSFEGRTALQDVLTPGAALYADGANWRLDQAPGSWFDYVNLNFGVIAQVMECATGERFDRLMQRLVLDPLALRGGFDPSAFPQADQADIATMVRKRRIEHDREVWDPHGPWVVQADDFRHTPPQPPAGLADYRIGSNGTLFGPQGRLRISLLDLGRLMRMLLDEGRHDGSAFLQPPSVALLSSPAWVLDRGKHNGDAHRDWACAWALGGQVFTDHSEAGAGGSTADPAKPPKPSAGDRLIEGGGFSGWGHTGDAYGFMGVFALDPALRRGMIVFANGPGADPARFASRWSAHYRWQELATTALARHALAA